jgi:hypothetical protein
MVGGPAVIVYPANHGVTGVMTFIVNQNGWSIRRISA